MEFLAHKHDEEKHRRHHLVHCVFHFALEVATLATAVITLYELEKTQRRISSRK